MEWIEPELIWVFYPAFADVFVRCEASQRQRGFPQLEVKLPRLFLGGMSQIDPKPRLK